MSLRFANLTDQQIIAKIQKLQCAIEDAVSGDKITVVAGEGRRMEVMKANIGEAKRMMSDYESEYYSRNPDKRPRGGRAIGVKFCG